MDSYVWIQFFGVGLTVVRYVNSDVWEFLRVK